VTRLGEFSPIGRLFTSGSVLKMTKAVQIFGLHIFSEKVMHQLWQQNGLGWKWGDFFYKILIQTLKK
jgi:hypothetical protein